MPDWQMPYRTREKPHARQPSCAVLVMSSDAYSDLWTPFFTLFWRFWPDCPFPVFLGTNRARSAHPRITNLPAGDREWSARLKSNLAEIETSYILLLLEDFFFTNPISTQQVLAGLTSLDELHGTVLRLYALPGPDIPVIGYNHIGQIDRFASYRVSAQAALWNSSRLSALLQENETIWDFERQGSTRSQAVEEGFYCSYEHVIPYRQVVERGQWFRSAAHEFGKEEIGCDLTARKVMTSTTAFRKAVVRRSKNLLDRVLPPRLRFRI